MRVSGGSLRGRALISPKGNDVRPTASVVKEALMSMLAFQLGGARVLDLFCGSGQMGIECLSRGAGECVFADISRESCRITRDNLGALGLEGSVMQSDWEQTLTALSVRGKSFDIIIADPPYRAGMYEKIQDRIVERGVLSPDGVLVLEHDKALPPEAVDGLSVLKMRSYGKRCLMLLQLKRNEQ